MDKKIDGMTVERQCHPRYVDEIKEIIKDYDCVLSMACGAGVQLMAEIYPKTEILVVSTIMCEIILCHIFHKWQVGGNFTYGFRPPVDFHL